MNQEPIDHFEPLAPFWKQRAGMVADRKVRRFECGLGLGLALGTLLTTAVAILIIKFS